MGWSRWTSVGPQPGVALTWLVLAVACAAGPQPQASNASGVSGAVTVLAAASLTDAFEEVAAALEADNSGVEVLLSFAGSQRLAAQLVEGAPADVFAAADDVQMDVVAGAGLVRGAPVPFAENTLALAVAPGNPLGLDRLSEVAGEGATVVLPDPAVPAGRYARRVLRRAGVTLRPVSLENDVRGVVSRVALGEADAGIVYRSDIVAAEGRVEGVEIPAAVNVTATYRVAALAGAPNPAGASAFVALLTSARGRAILREHGFAAP